jgi:hypothetical protein
MVTALNQWRQLFWKWNRFADLAWLAAAFL